MPKIKGLSHVVLYVNDLDKMVAFYQDVLGLVKYHEHPGRMVFMTLILRLKIISSLWPRDARATPRSSHTLPGA